MEWTIYAPQDDYVPGASGPDEDSDQSMVAEYEHFWSSDSDTDSCQDNEPAEFSTDELPEWGRITHEEGKDTILKEKILINVQIRSLLDSYQQLITDKILEIIVTASNKYAQEVTSKVNLKRNVNGAKQWGWVTVDEMKLFLGIFYFDGDSSATIFTTLSD